MYGPWEVLTLYHGHTFYEVFIIGKLFLSNVTWVTLCTCCFCLEWTKDTGYDIHKLFQHYYKDIGLFSPFMINLYIKSFIF